jgi:hypothetical protein
MIRYNMIQYDTMSFMFCTPQQTLGRLNQIDKRVGKCNMEYKYTKFGQNTPSNEITC